jgi:NADPH:quinone reductase-like Zn-dependent oxidoreductase
MKAAVYRKAGAGKVLEIRDLDQPLPKDNEVLLRVRAASVNPLDWRMKTERPGVDVAGEIVAVGKNVKQFKPGDAAFGAGKGAFAEYACARESKLAPKPEGVSFEQAAAVPIAGMTALQALRDVARLKPGQKVLINGASGGIGTFAVQIALTRTRLPRLKSRACIQMLSSWLPVEIASATDLARPTGIVPESRANRKLF